MSNEPDYKKFAILYVDDEEKSLKSFARAFGDQFRIFTAATAQEGFKIFEEHRDEIGVLMTDQRMPGEKGVWLLEKARQLRPRILRILVTAYSDHEAVIAAVNTGAIYKYISKPWDPPLLEMTLRRSLEFFTVQQERDQLMDEKMAGLHHAMVADRIVSLGLLAAGMSHHIRNALVAVKTFLDLAPAKLKEEKLDPEQIRNPEFWNDYHREVQAQVAKINDLLKDLWLASENSPLSLGDQVRLEAVVSRVLADLQPALAAGGIGVETRISASVPALSGDKSKFMRLFELLLKDELASLPRGSRIVISAAPSPASGEVGAGVRIEIEDDGPGLEEEALRRLFDPFLVRNDSPKEYGINLMACFFIVHRHGGRIGARRAAPHGTIFTIDLPADASQPPSPEQSQEWLQKVFSNQALWENLLSS